MLKKYLPWSLQGAGQFLNTYGDAWLFGGVRRTPPMPCNPDAATGLHSPIPHRYVHAWILAAKSFLLHHADIAVFVHDDGSLTGVDKALIREQIPGARVIDRAEANARFEREIGDAFLARVRGSYTSYLKLFDPTLWCEGRRIILLDSDTLFLRRPDVVIDWAMHGGVPFYHLAPRGRMKRNERIEAPRANEHPQTRILAHLDGVNERLGTTYRMEQGFNSGFIGYAHDLIRYDALKHLLEELHGLLGERIFRWGAEQTMHGLVTCGAGAQPLPAEDYFVFTQFNAAQAAQAVFLHFVGENRFHHLIYPRLGRRVMARLRSRHTIPSHA